MIDENKIWTLNYVVAVFYIVGFESAQSFEKCMLL